MSDIGMIEAVFWGFAAGVLVGMLLGWKAAMAGFRDAEVQHAARKEVNGG